MPLNQSEAPSYNKAIASGIAGAVSIIAVYVIQRMTGEPLPSEIVTAVQTLLTVVVVWATPHGPPPL